MDSNGTDQQSSRRVDDCQVCRQLRLVGPEPRDFHVAPARGGGWHVWSAALLRFVERIGHQPTRAIVISQTLLGERYVQVLVGHGLAHAETGSNVYLTGDSRLSTDDEAMLSMLGWVAPASGEDPPAELTANWTLPLIRGDWQYLIEVLLATMVGVLGFDSHLPIEVRSFGCSHPCRDCSWT